MYLALRNDTPSSVLHAAVPVFSGDFSSKRCLFPERNVQFHNKLLVPFSSLFFSFLSPRNVRFFPVSLSVARSLLFFSAFLTLKRDIKIQLFETKKCPKYQAGSRCGRSAIRQLANKYNLRLFLQVLHMNDDTSQRLLPALLVQNSRDPADDLVVLSWSGCNSSPDISARHHAYSIHKSVCYLCKTPRLVTTPTAVHDVRTRGHTIVYYGFTTRSQSSSAQKVPASPQKRFFPVCLRAPSHDPKTQSERRPSKTSAVKRFRL